MKTFTKYEEVGKSVGLKGIALKTYIAYMKERWSDSEDIKVETGYAHEWAERFKRGDEWNRSDFEGQRVLRKLSITYGKK